MFQSSCRIQKFFLKIRGKLSIRNWGFLDVILKLQRGQGSRSLISALVKEPCLKLLKLIHTWWSEYFKTSMSPPVNQILWEGLKMMFLSRWSSDSLSVLMFADQRYFGFILWPYSTLLRGGYRLFKRLTVPLLNFSLPFFTLPPAGVSEEGPSRGVRDGGWGGKPHGQPTSHQDVDAPYERLTHDKRAFCSLTSINDHCVN